MAVARVVAPPLFLHSSRTTVTVSAGLGQIGHFSKTKRVHFRGVRGELQ